MLQLQYVFISNFFLLLFNRYTETSRKVRIENITSKKIYNNGTKQALFMNFDIKKSVLSEEI